MPRAIVFDLFGVVGLTQSDEDKRRLEGLAGVAPETFWEAYWAVRRPYDAGQSAEDYWAAVGERAGVRFGGDTVRALTDTDLLSWSNADETMVSLVTELGTAGHVIGLLSNIVEGLVPVFEARHKDWLAHFTALTYSCDIGVTKPDPRAYEIAASRLGVELTDCLFIDDTEVNVVGAREVGMRAEVFRSPAQVRALAQDHLGAS
jgi:putative hydrolase of the HAD superfamily